MTQQLLAEKLRKNLEITDGLFEKYFPKDATEVLKAAAYSFFTGGKRLRAFLVLSCAERYGVLDENSERLAVAIEMIHAYSLVHDDLPCMDNDDVRRGKPTSHKVFGEAGAVLAGDCLLNLAFEILLEGEMTKGYQKAVSFIARAAGYTGMLNGQFVELTAPEYAEEALLSITKQKTGALIKAAAKVSALYAQKDNETLDLIDNFSEAFGIAFQLADDLMDYVVDADMLCDKAAVCNTENTHGQSNSDSTLDKCADSSDDNGVSQCEMNYVDVLGKRRTKELLETYTQKALTALKKLGLENSAEAALMVYNTSRTV